MARLKVKQISDIGTYVQGLIDNDSDQNATLISNNAASISAVSTALANEATSTGNEVDALEASVESLELIAGGTVTADLALSVDSLETVDTNQSTSIANNASSIGVNAGDITKIYTQLGANDDDNLALTASVDSLESLAGGNIIANLAASVLDNDTRVDSILQGATADLDQFAEVIAYVNSVDTVGDLDLTNALAVVNASIDSLERIDTVISTALSAEIVATDGEIDDLQDSVDALEAADVLINASIDSLELVAGGSTIKDLNDELDLVSTALSSEIVTTDAEISALQGDVAALGLSDKMLHQEAGFVDKVTFTLATPVRFGANDDIHVHINGHTIKPFVEGKVEGRYADHGWSSADGQTFTLNNIGYDYEISDVLYVQAIEA